ncbi:MAG TPA: DUF5693 family protein [Trueperaceae bacterium]
MRFLLWLLILLSLIPALILTGRRIQAEGSARRVTMIMDEAALIEQARALGWEPMELALHYQELGLEGISVYEETPESLAEAGEIIAMPGYELQAAVVASGGEPPRLPPGATVMSELEAGALDAALAKTSLEPQRFEWRGRTWYAFPGDVFDILPAGADEERLDSYAEAGFDIAYRPRNHPLLSDIDFPEQAHYLIHNGLEVAGLPDLLNETIEESQEYLTGVIEGTQQSGMARIAGRVPSVRLLSFNQEYINLRLRPGELVDKYLLAANERGITLLYLRPYTEPQLGNMLDNTEALVSGLRTALENEGFEVGPLRTLQVDYRTNAFLRGLSSLGVLAGLLLLGLAYPAPWGAFVSLAVLALGLVAGGIDWDAVALIAALVFPVLGYAYLRERLVSLGVATLISLAGALLLVAVGSDQASMSAISPFRGVAATLVVPPLLFAAHYALRFQRPAEWIRELWGHQVRLGDVAVVLVGFVALALVFLRRGNFPLIGASEAELAFRSWLAELFVRPRFKELLGHPLAVLGLTNREWPAWIKGALLTGGVVAQASILNSFSHYHTPVLISLQRTLIALGLGLLIGLVLLPFARLAVRLVRSWLTPPVPRHRATQ